MNQQNFQHLMTQLRETGSDPVTAGKLAEQIMSESVVDLLQNERLYGEVLLQLPRRYSYEISAIMGLKWRNNSLELVINPHELSKLKLSDELPNLLKHEVLHIVWQHPIRYRNYSHQNNVSIATDVAVNQYLSSAPVGTMTLEKLQPLLDDKLPTREDSQRYLTIIEHGKLNNDDRSDSDESTKLDRQADTDRQQISNSPSQNVHTDSHDGWQTDSDQQNESQQVANLKQMLDSAWKNTPDKQRGLLPGKVREQLEQVNDEPRLNWRQLFKKSLGTIPLGKKNSYARFNRRQPVRMDLPGQITNMVVNVEVFVDNSGSMGQREISYLLNQIRDIMKVYEAKLTVYSFDTVVHGDDAYEVKQYSQIRFERIGGGGTSFQSIFNFLHQQHATNNDTLAIVLTDGWGESKIEPYHFTNVLWVLTTQRSELSVENVNQRVVSLQDDPNYQAITGGLK